MHSSYKKAKIIISGGVMKAYDKSYNLRCDEFLPLYESVVHHYKTPWPPIGKNMKECPRKTINWSENVAHQSFHRGLNLQQQYLVVKYRIRIWNRLNISGHYEKILTFAPISTLAKRPSPASGIFDFAT